MVLNNFLRTKSDSDEEGVSGKDDSPVDIDVVDLESRHLSNVDDGVGEVNRALKHRHLQMIGIGGGTLNFTNLLHKKPF